MGSGEEAEPHESLLTGLKEAPAVLVMDGFKVQPKQNRTQWKQWAACISATMSMVAAGTVYGWSTTTTTRLTNSTSDVPFIITDDESSWIISVTVIGSMMGAFLGAYITTSFGRKLCLLLTSLFYIVGWLLVMFAVHVWFLYSARVILGIGVGMSYTANPTYISEVADVSIRGALSTLMAVNVFTGSLIACSVGPWSEYWVLNVVCLAVPVLFVLSFVWFPESPYFLVSKGRSAEAKRAIGFFKGISDERELQEELDDVRKNIGDDTDNELKFQLADVLLLSKVRNRRALVIVMGLILGQQLSGNFSTMQYLEKLFADAHINIDTHIATIMVIAVGLLSGAISTMTVENAGRRMLLLYSTMGCAISLGALGLYLKLVPSDEPNPGPEQLDWWKIVPVIAVILFQVAYQIGLGTMPNLLIGELFPTNVKGIAGAIITIFDGLMGFVVSKLYPSVSAVCTYFLFSGSCFVLFVFVFSVVPETKRKTFIEIQEILRNLRPFKVSRVFRERVKNQTEEA